jgi:hypothetical protein
MQTNPLIKHEIIKLANGRQVVIKTFLNCITGLKQFSNKCLEELRYEDYILNKKYPQHIPINGSYQVEYNNCNMIIDEVSHESLDVENGATNNLMMKNIIDSAESICPICLETVSTVNILKSLFFLKLIVIFLS